MTPRWRPATPTIPSSSSRRPTCSTTVCVSDTVRATCTSGWSCWNSPRIDRQDASTGPGGGADLEPALELALGFLAEVREQLLLERDQPLRSAVEPETGLGRLDPAAGAVEELLADALLQRPDLQAHRRLRHPELVGGLREAAALDNRTKGRELLRVHKANL